MLPSTDYRYICVVGEASNCFYEYVSDFFSSGLIFDRLIVNSRLRKLVGLYIYMDCNIIYQQEAQLTQRDRATARAHCQVKSCEMLHKCSTDCI